jgi:hypothetical protein
LPGAVAVRSPRDSGPFEVGFADGVEEAVELGG